MSGTVILKLISDVIVVLGNEAIMCFVIIGMESLVIVR